MHRRNFRKCTSRPFLNTCQSHPRLIKRVPWLPHSGPMNREHELFAAQPRQEKRETSRLSGNERYADERERERESLLSTSRHARHAGRKFTAVAPQGRNLFCRITRNGSHPFSSGFIFDERDSLFTRVRRVRPCWLPEFATAAARAGRKGTAGRPGASEFKSSSREREREKHFVSEI